MKENLRLRKGLAGKEKEILFLKISKCHRRWQCILRKGNRLEAYRFIDQNHQEFGIRWLLLRLKLCPNAYYKYRKNRKAEYYTQKESVLRQIEEIYHKYNGVPGYRSMCIYLERGIRLATIHKYMNIQLRLHSIVRPEKPGCQTGKPHKVFASLLAQDFSASAPNRRWCTDFIYLFLKGGEVRYNCTIIDLYDRSVVAGITDCHITSDLAVRTPGKAMESRQGTIENLILHSDQGSQYTSRGFAEFCESAHVIQSMSKAGYPYDNAPMERCFNTLKNECTNLYAFKREEELSRAVEEFAYVTYNHVRPHSYNAYRTPYHLDSRS